MSSDITVQRQLVEVEFLGASQFRLKFKDGHPASPGEEFLQIRTHLPPEVRPRFMPGALVRISFDLEVPMDA